MSRSGELYRDTENGKISGVCAGIANYFGLERWLVRILVVTAFFLLAGTFIVIGYVACWFILDVKPSSGVDDRQTNFVQTDGKGWRNPGRSDDSTHRVAVKTKVWQAGEPPKKAFQDIAGRFRESEIKLRRMEKYVTSREFQLNREISRL